MRVIEVGEEGPPEGLRQAVRAVPEARPSEVLIKVAAAGMNRADCMQRRGQYPPPPGVSDLLGLEVSGTVAAVGAAVLGWRVGDPVCALLAGGGYAEYTSVPARQCLPVPAGVDLVDAAALPEVALTVWTNVFDRARLQPGETLLVHGGSSGIGTMAIQLAHALGSRVLVTAGSAEKCAACEALGAAVAINYREDDLAGALKHAAGKAGIDVILDMVAAPYLKMNLDLLNVEGRLVLIALMGGSTTEIDLSALMFRRLTVTGSTLRARSVEEKGAVVDAVRERVWPLIEAGRVRPVVHRRVPMTHVVDAHHEMEASTHIGKILLTT